MISRLTGVAAVLLTAGALLTLPGPAHAAAPDQPMAKQCRTLTYAEVAGDTDPSSAVPCGQAHTAYTVAVPSFPSGIDPATASPADLVAAAETTCASAVAPYFRGSAVQQDMALWTWAYFVPTDAQLAAGANWVECDVAVLWPGKRLMPMPTMRPRLYAGKRPAVAGACRTRKRAVVPCSQAHSWKPAGGFIVSRTGYPSRKRFLQDGRRCHTIAKTGQYLVSWPRKADWKAGDHAIVCSKPSKS